MRWTWTFLRRQGAYGERQRLQERQLGQGLEDQETIYQQKISIHIMIHLVKMIGKMMGEECL